MSSAPGQQAWCMDLITANPEQAADFLGLETTAHCGPKLITHNWKAITSSPDRMKCDYFNGTTSDAGPCVKPSDHFLSARWSKSWCVNLLLSSPEFDGVCYLHSDWLWHEFWPFLTFIWSVLYEEAKNPKHHPIIRCESVVSSIDGFWQDLIYHWHGSSGRESDKLQHSDSGISWHITPQGQHHNLWKPHQVADSPLTPDLKCLPHPSNLFCSLLLDGQQFKCHDAAPEICQVAFPARAQILRLFLFILLFLSCEPIRSFRCQGKKKDYGLGEKAVTFRCSDSVTPMHENRPQFFALGRELPSFNTGRQHQVFHGVE